MKRQTTIRQYQAIDVPDMDAIRKVSGNPDLQPDQVFCFPPFTIARSGRNYNNTDITDEGQVKAVNDWIGKPIMSNGHGDETPDNVAGRIYAAWTEEDWHPGRKDKDPDKDKDTVTKGKAYAILAESPEGKDEQARIANRIVAEMSCEYDVLRSVCSICGDDVTKQACRLHSQDPGYFCRDMEFIPLRVAYVVDPAIEGAGTQTHSRADDDESTLRLHRLADDGQIFRDWVKREFSKWYRLNNRQSTQQEVDSLSDNLTARQMVNLAQIQQSKYREVLPSGEQQIEPPKQDDATEPVCAPQFRSLSDIFSRRI